LFKVEYCAICVGETKVYDWTSWAATDKTLGLPTVLGHEASGVVVEVGPAVKNFKPGDRIVNDPLIYCGACRNCRDGFTNVCEHREIYGKRRGAFAEYAVLPERVICPLSDKLSLEEGAVLENLGIAVHAVEAEPHDPGDWAVILGGGGPIGILAAQVLSAAGVNTILTDVSPPRLKLAADISGALVIDARKEDAVGRVMTETRGRGADFVIEMGATQTVLDQAFQVVRTRGTIVTIGTFDEPVTFNPFFAMTRREVRLQSVIGRNWQTWRRMNQLIEAQKLRLRPLISHILPLDEFDRGFELVKSREVAKVLLQPF
jgi:threonine 3-dehydrogenase